MENALKKIVTFDNYLIIKISHYLKFKLKILFLQNKVFSVKFVSLHLRHGNRRKIKYGSVPEMIFRLCKIESKYNC